MMAKSLFFLPAHLHATAPPEKRGIRRDEVKLMVSDRLGQTIIHSEFSMLGHFLKRGDVLILNNSRTIPACLQADLFCDGNPIGQVEVRLARKLGNSQWDSFINGHTPSVGDRLRFSGQMEAKIEILYPDNPLAAISFLCSDKNLSAFIYKHGEPIRYEYIREPWALEAYQTVFGTVPGSVEMPSAGRAFSWEMLFMLQKMGIKIGFLQLHTGLSYVSDDEAAFSPSANPENYSVPKETIELIQEAKQEGRRVIAAGTTVVRALETAFLSGLEGTTNLHIKEGFELKAVDGILTGLHEPEASHLDLLSAFIAPENLMQAYDQAIAREYLWHEFGDMHLVL